MSQRFCRNRTGCFSLFGTVAGCSSDRQHSDLDKKMSDARTRPQGVIEPLPEYPAAERFNYSALALRSPFEAPVDYYWRRESFRQSGVGSRPDRELKSPLS